MRTVFETIVGSHMWKMQRKDSDRDHFVCYAAPTKKILSGELVYPVGFSSFAHEKGEDTSAHEAQTVVDQLIKGNVNFLWGVMSPVVVKTSRWHKELKEIVKRNLAKNCYNSIHGLAVHNYKKYVESGRDMSEKRCNTIARSALFGAMLLRYGRVEFIPFFGADPEDAKAMIASLDQAYKESELPGRPNEAEFRNWLYRLRIAQLGR